MQKKVTAIHDQLEEGFKPDERLQLAVIIGYYLHCMNSLKSAHNKYIKKNNWLSTFSTQ